MGLKAGGRRCWTGFVLASFRLTMTLLNAPMLLSTFVILFTSLPVGLIVGGVLVLQALSDFLAVFRGQARFGRLFPLPRFGHLVRAIFALFAAVLAVIYSLPQLGFAALTQKNRLTLGWVYWPTLWLVACECLTVSRGLRRRFEGWLWGQKLDRAAPLEWLCDLLMGAGIVSVVLWCWTDINVPENFDGIQFKKYVGGGAFGKVFLATDAAGRSVAVKRINKSSTTNATQALREVNFLRQLGEQENIIKLYDVKEDSNYFYLVEEFAENGELFDFVASGMREDIALYYFRQLVAGLEYLHEHNLCHRDLKLENILLNGSYTMKICDFGLSHAIEGDKPLRTMCGSPAYVAPEVFRGQGYDGAKADIWSAGIILCALVSATLPVEDRAVDTDPLYTKLKRREFDYDPWGVTLNGYAADLCKRMLDPNPATRATWAEIKNHPWYLGASVDSGLPIPIMELEPYMRTQKETSMQEEAILSGSDGMSSGAGQSDMDAPVFAVPGFGPRAAPAAPRIAAPGEMPFWESQPVTARATTLVLPASESVDSVLERLEYLLGSERGAAVKVNRAAFRVKAKMPSANPERRLDLVISMYRHRKGNMVLEFTRAKGDTMQFHRLFHDIRPSLE
ncbi:putative CBL-interacting protein kinase 23 [Paratrimastix pyriformis]|uniref:CBL-interacting protein kinase 23 n=1 Tax=Paratrimastix pyriformis TaxID=342808 RepID=A0ABQ8UU28_9EUKA|nr:putative CBL-interacting protein kinase 23 [Paratrimastix pyriformis]